MSETTPSETPVSQKGPIGKFLNLFGAKNGNGKDHSIQYVAPEDPKKVWKEEQKRRQESRRKAKWEIVKGMKARRALETMRNQSLG